VCPIASVTKFCAVAPNIFYVSIVDFCAYIQKYTYVSSLAQSMKYQIPARFTGHSRVMGRHYGISCHSSVA
jgi:hypothetical protein